MPITINAYRIQTPHSLPDTDQAMTVNVSVTNSFSNLSHLVIYGYKKWLESDAQAELYVLDSATDNMEVAYGKMEYASSGLYRIQAYFDYSNEIEGILYLPTNDSELNLLIHQGDDMRSLTTRLPAYFISAKRAEIILNPLPS